jgi:hypothetical protein
LESASTERHASSHFLSTCRFKWSDLLSLSLSYRFLEGCPTLTFINIKVLIKILEKLDKFFDKTQNNDLLISPKRKKAILEMSLKSSIMSKLDHQMSRI